MVQVRKNISKTEVGDIDINTWLDTLPGFSDQLTVDRMRKAFQLASASQKAALQLLEGAHAEARVALLEESGQLLEKELVVVESPSKSRSPAKSNDDFKHQNQTVLFAPGTATFDAMQTLADEHQRLRRGLVENMKPNHNDESILNARARETAEIEDLDVQEREDEVDALQAGLLEPRDLPPHEQIETAREREARIEGESARYIARA